MDEIADHQKKDLSRDGDQEWKDSPFWNQYVTMIK